MTTMNSKPHLPPGSPVYYGEQKLDEVSIRHILYNASAYEEREDIAPEELNPAEDHVNFYLIRGLHDAEKIASIGQKIQLHPLSVEDILHMNTRNKMEEYPEYFLFIMRLLYLGDAGRVETEQISFVIKNNSLFAFAESKRPELRSLFERLKKGAPLRYKDADDLLAAILDLLVDQYFEIFDIIARKFDNLEEEIAKNPMAEQLEGVHSLKKDLIHLREVLWPLRESLSKLSKSYVSKVDGDTIYYMRDVEDHVIQLLQLVETYQEISTSLVDSYLSSIGNRTNEVMKVLTIFSTIFIPLTFLAGVYGMNFRHMPELEQKWAYPLFWVICGITLVLLVRYFKKKNWI